METKTSFTLDQRIKAATTVFVAMAIANFVLLLVSIKISHSQPLSVSPFLPD